MSDTCYTLAHVQILRDLLMSNTSSMFILVLDRNVLLNSGLLMRQEDEDIELTFNCQLHESRAWNAADRDNARISSGIFWKGFSDHESADAQTEWDLIIRAREYFYLVSEPLHLVWDWIGWDGAFQRDTLSFSHCLVAERLIWKKKLSISITTVDMMT